MMEGGGETRGVAPATFLNTHYVKSFFMTNSKISAARQFKWGEHSSINYFFHRAALEAFLSLSLSPISRVLSNAADLADVMAMGRLCALFMVALRFHVK